MRVAVEDPVAEDHRHPGLRHHVREPAALVLRELARLEVGDLRSVEELERQHTCARVAPEHARDAHVRMTGEVPVERVGVTRLLAVVELLAHGAGELVDEPLRVDEVERADAFLRDLRRLVEQGEVRLDLPGRARALHLHGDAAAVGENGLVHLADGGGGDRLLDELDEQPLDRLAQLLQDHLLDLRERERADVVLELSQLDDDVRRDDVRPRGEELTELHERRAELVERLPQAPTALRRRVSVGRDLLPRQQVGQLVA